MGKQELLALLLIIGDVVIIAIVVFFLNRYYSERLKKDRQNQADSIIGNAKENSENNRIRSKR